MRRVNLVVELPKRFRKREFKVSIGSVKRFTPDKFAAQLASIRKEKEREKPLLDWSSSRPETEGEDEIEKFLEKREQQTGSRSAVLLEDEFIVEAIQRHSVEDGRVI